MRKIIAIGLIGITLTAVTAPARAGDEAAAFVLGTLVGSALADDGHGTRIVVSHHSHPEAYRYHRGDRAYARGYRDAKRSLRYAPPPKAWRHGYRHGYHRGRAHGHRHGWGGRRHVLPAPAARDIYRQGYRDARRDARHAERRQEWREERREQRHAEVRDFGRETRRGVRPARHEHRRHH